MQERLALLLSVFAVIGRRGSRPGLCDLAGAMRVPVARLRAFRRAFKRPPHSSERRALAAAAARLLDLPEAALRRYIEAGDETVQAALQARHQQHHTPRSSAAPWAPRVQALLATFGAAGRHRPSPFRPAQQDLAQATGISIDRLGKLTRKGRVPSIDEARRISQAAAQVLDLDPATLCSAVLDGTPDLAALLPGRPPLRSVCLHCGAPPRPLDPFAPGTGMHRSCRRALRAPQQAAWAAEVERHLAAAPPALQQAWHAVTTAGERVTFGRLASVAGLPLRAFLRLWDQARLPRRARAPQRCLAMSSAATR